MLKELTEKLQSFFPYPKRTSLEDWDFIFVFEEYYKGEVELMFSSLKCQSEIAWTVVDNPMEKQALFLLRLSDQVMKEMAHDLKILKIKNKRSYEIKLKEINLLSYLTDKQANPHIYNYLCFLRARLYPGNSEIYEQQKYSAFNINKQSKYPLNQKGKLFTTEEQLRAKYHFLLTYSEKIITNLQNPIAVSDSCKQPFNILMKNPGFVELVPIQKVSQHKHLIFESLRDTVGPNIDCYFDFVTFLQKWLVFPMIVGLLVVGFNSYYDFTADNSPFDFIYALVIMLWSILFITRWQQIQKWNKVKSSGGRSELWTQSQEMISRKSFEKHYSNVTGLVQYHLPTKLKILLSVASNLACFIMMFLTLIFIVYSLNARGFIDPEHKLFYSETVSQWASVGGIFDSTTFWGQVPNIVHVVVTNGFDENVYRPAVKKLAKLQRHETRKGYENSVILKYFIYQFVITFADLFYIAFVRLDIEGLREQLLSLFFIDIVRRVVAETVVPFIMKKRRESQSLKYLQKSVSDKNIKEDQNKELQEAAIHEVNKQNYEPFDDYLEIISNMGYLVMISSCFPLAPLLILVAHQVELIQDKYKVIHIFKRKLPQSYVGMGRWKDIIVFICYISIITNIMLFAFSSQQVVSFFPKLYDGGLDLLYGNTDIATIIGGVTAGLLENINNITADIGISNQFISTQNWLPIFDSQSQLPTAPTDNEAPFILDENSILPQIQQPEQKFTEEESCNAQPFESHYPSHSPPPFMVKQFMPPKQQSQITFMAILFFIQHFFLLLFIFIRDMLKRRKSQAEIFQERRQYKRRIKKNLPPNALQKLTVTLLLNNWISKEGSKGLWKAADPKIEPSHPERLKTKQPQINKSSISTANSTSNQTQEEQAHSVSKIFLRSLSIKEE